LNPKTVSVARSLSFVILPISIYEQVFARLECDKSDKVWRSLGEGGEEGGMSDIWSRAWCQTQTVPNFALKGAILNFSISKNSKKKLKKTLLSKVPFSSELLSTTFSFPRQNRFHHFLYFSSACPAPAPQLLLSCLIIQSPKSKKEKREIM